MADRDRKRSWRVANPGRVLVDRRRRVKFLSKAVMVHTNPRTGICSICGRLRPEGHNQFDLHHYGRYSEDDPLDKTVELCPKCHRYQHGRSARLLRKLLRVEGRTLGAVLTRGDADMVIAEEIASAAP